MALDPTLDVTTAPASTAPAPPPPRAADLRDPAFQAFWMLRIVFTVAPILVGLDKLTGDHLAVWDAYLAPRLDDLVPGSAHQAMLVIGVIEIAAGVLVAVWPHIGGYVVAAWLAGIILDLVLIPGYYDVAVRDLGLLVGALALARLAWAFRPSTTSPRSARLG